MIKSIPQRPETILVLVFVWKILLLVATAQPIPSDDAFFYDGPVVNFLLHGKYANPALELALSISGGDVFCAYPPLYQLLLLGWMSLFGISALSAMALHLVLFGIYLVLLVAVFRRLNLPVWCVHIAALFLLVITFQDRPDSLAHVLGIGAVFAWIRSWPSRSAGASHLLLPLTPDKPNARWVWAMVVMAVLCLATSLQVGGVYFLVLWMGTLAASFFRGERFPGMPMLAMTTVPIALVGLVAFGFPHLWDGFLEHARQTPSLTGLRLPTAAEILKLIRTAPGVLAVAVLLPWVCRRRPQVSQTPVWLVTVACTLAALTILAASMCVLTANSVFFASYLQPLIVGCYLALAMMLISERQRLRFQSYAFIALSVLGSVRAVGMSTWGVACAMDVSYPSAIQRVRTVLTDCPRHSAVVLSSPFLYEAARQADLQWIQSDWMTPAQRGGPNKDLEALVRLKPVRVILTQFEYFRRFEPVLEELKSRPELSRLDLLNSARTPPPDSFKSLQKVVQNISWAPVIVTLSWK